jgi:hypothetical protein
MPGSGDKKKSGEGRSGGQSYAEGNGRDEVPLKNGGIARTGSFSFGGGGSAESSFFFDKSDLRPRETQSRGKESKSVHSNPSMHFQSVPIIPLEQNLPSVETLDSRGSWEQPIAEIISERFSASLAVPDNHSLRMWIGNRNTGSSPSLPPF